MLTCTLSNIITAGIFHQKVLVVYIKRQHLWSSTVNENRYLRMEDRTPDKKRNINIKYTIITKKLHVRM